MGLAETPFSQSWDGEQGAQLWEAHVGEVVWRGRWFGPLSIIFTEHGDRRCRGSRDFVAVEGPGNGFSHIPGGIQMVLRGRRDVLFVGIGWGKRTRAGVMGSWSKDLVAW